MSGGLRDICSVSRIFFRTMQSTAIQTLRHGTPCQLRSFNGKQPSCSTIELYSQLSLLQILRSGRIQCSQLVAPISIAIIAHPLKLPSRVQTRAHVQSRSSYQTSAISTEKPFTTHFLFEPDEREEIKQAMTEFLELTLGVERKLALHISKNSPVFIDGIAEKVKAAQKVSPSNLDKSLNVLVKDILTSTKFEGVEPYLEVLGVNPKEVGRLSEYAKSGIKGILGKVDLLKAIGVQPEDIPKVIMKSPRLLSCPVVNNHSKAQYLTRLGMSPDDICKIVISYPNALSFGLKNGELPVVNFLKQTGVKDKELGKVFSRCPQLLTLNVEKKLRPAIESLESVGITGDYLARVLVLQPSLLRRKLQTNIAFCRDYGLDEKPGVIARLLITCPNFSVSGFRARVNYLKSTGLTMEQILIMINKNPAFMSLNVDSSLAPKVDYLVKDMGRSVEELVSSVAFLTMSLENRIKPRHRVLMKLNSCGIVSRMYSLSTLVGWSDQVFFRKFVEKSPTEVKELWIKQILGNKDSEPKLESELEIGDDEPHPIGL